MSGTEVKHRNEASKAKTVTWSNKLHSWKEGKQTSRGNTTGFRKHRKTSNMSEHEPRTVQEQDEWEMMKAKYMFQILMHPPAHERDDFFLNLCTTKSDLSVFTALRAFLCSLRQYITFDEEKLGNSLRSLRELPDGEKVLWKAIEDDKLRFMPLFLVNILTQKSVLMAFRPAFYEITEADSAQRNLVDAMHTVDMLSNDKDKPWVWHYGLMCDPKNPHDAINGLIRRWNIEYGGDGNLPAQEVGGKSSAASSITSHRSRSPKKLKPNNPVKGGAKEDEEGQATAK